MREICSLTKSEICSLRVEEKIHEKFSEFSLIAKETEKQGKKKEKRKAFLRLRMSRVNLTTFT